MSSVKSALCVLILVLVAVTLTVAQFDKNKAVGPCIGQKCPDGHVCHEDECYPTPPPQSDDPMGMYDDEKPRNNQPIGPCINNLCPAGYTCRSEDYKCY